MTYRLFEDLKEISGDEEELNRRFEYGISAKGLELEAKERTLVSSRRAVENRKKKAKRLERGT